MGLVSKRVRSSDPDHAAKVRERTLVSSLPELRTAAERLESLITDTRQYTGAVSLDISHASMTSQTAKGFYKTTINGADYLCDYFNHIGDDDLLDLGNNPTFLKMKLKLLGRGCLNTTTTTTTHQRQCGRCSNNATSIVSSLETWGRFEWTFKKEKKTRL